MKAYVNDIEVEFTDNQVETLEKVTEIPGNTLPRPPEEYRTIFHSSRGELKQILGAVNYCLEEDMDESGRVTLLTLRKELKEAIKAIENLES